VILDRNAQLIVSDEGANIATVGFAMFRTGWTYHGPEPNGSNPGNPMSARVVFPGGQVALQGAATVLADGIQFVLEATPSTTVGIESAFLGASLPESAWAGGIAIVDGTSYALPAVYNGNNWPFGGNARTIRLVNGDLELTIEGSTSRSSILQDSRQWGPYFEWRYGNEGGPWNSGAKRTYTVTLRSPRGLEFSVQQPYTITSGSDWLPLPFPLDVVPGSALDWSPRETAPAGSKGWLRARGGKFFFDKDPSPQRFYGANVNFSALFMDYADSERLALRLARMGYNAIRFHHFDVELTGWSGGSSSTVIDAVKMDRLNYLIAALKKRGIYISIDLFSLRQIRNGEVMPGVPEMDEYKGLQLVSQAARDNWLAYASNLMNTYNPYTKLRWKDDPAIAWICVVNENNMGNVAQSLSAYSRALFDQAWQAAGNTGTWTHASDAGAKFGAELHRQTYAWMRDRLRAMGVKALLTDNNGWYEQRALILNRSQLDLVDNHNYWDHPQFLGSTAWAPPSRGWSGGGMAVKAMGGALQNMALSRVKGKPFTVTEFNFTAPNRYRAEGGLFMGALAARQDWDAVFRFAWSHDASNVLAARPMGYFDVQSDPANLATERAIVALFLRGDLPPAADEGVLRIDPANPGAGIYDAPMKNQIFSRRLYSSTTEGGNGNLSAPTSVQPVQIDAAKGILSVDAGRTAGVFGPIGDLLVAGPMEATLSGHRAALWVSSLDGKPISTSGRMLLSHVTDVQNTGSRFSGPDREVLEEWGTTPHLLRAGGASIRIASSVASRLKVYRLDMAGNRVAEVPSTVQNGRLVFTISNGGAPSPTLYHEISLNAARRTR
jgi:hypothetical protein